SNNADFRWISISQLPHLEPVRIPSTERPEKTAICLRLDDGASIEPYPALEKWLQPQATTLNIIYTVASLATVTLTQAGPRFEFRSPESSELPPWDFALPSIVSGTLLLLPYSTEIKELLSVHMPIQSVNRHHPLTRIARDARWLEEKTDLQKFARELIWRL